LRGRIPWQSQGLPRFARDKASLPISLYHTFLIHLQTSLAFWCFSKKFTMPRGALGIRAIRAYSLKRIAKKQKEL
jgi:hypothetical protein